MKRVLEWQKTAKALEPATTVMGLFGAKICCQDLGVAIDGLNW
jgi:hypothetical protein